MSIRESMEKHRGVTIVAAVLVLVAAVGIAFQNGTFSSRGETLKTRTFYTADDGKTWFVDDAEKSPPFDHDGKPAYRVRVFTCDGGKTKFAGYLERYTPDAQKRLAAAQRGDFAAAGMPQGRSVLSLVDELSVNGTEIKKPGASEKWVPRNDSQAAAPILDVRGPGGEIADPVLP
jgi:hypothetical protein